MSDVTPVRPVPRTTDHIASAVFASVRAHVNAWVGQEAWAEVKSEVTDVDDVLYLNGIPVKCVADLDPRRIIVFIGSFKVSDFLLPVKVAAPVLPGKPPAEGVSH